MWSFAFLLVLQELWTYQGFFLVAFKLYTSGSSFNYNHWVKVLLIPLVRVSLINVGLGFYQNLNFSFLGQVFQYCLLALKAYRLRFTSFGIRAQVLKSVFYPFIFCFLLSSYLVPFVFFIPCSYFVTCTRLKLCTQLPKKKKWKKRRDGNYWKHYERFNLGQI